MSGIRTFGRYLANVWDRFRHSRPPPSNRDIGISLALYFVYPMLLYLIFEFSFHLCGQEMYDIKELPRSACRNIYLPFTILLRTNKLLVILWGSVEGSAKRGEDDGDEEEDSPLVSATSSSSGLTRFKCRTWFHLLQEFLVVFMAAFLLSLCLAVLAFWVMFISICLSVLSLTCFLWRIWRESQYTYPDEDDGDEELQELVPTNYQEEEGDSQVEESS